MPSERDEEDRRTVEGRGRGAPAAEDFSSDQDGHGEFAAALEAVELAVEQFEGCTPEEREALAQQLRQLREIGEDRKVVPETFLRSFSGYTVSTINRAISARWCSTLR